MLIQEMDGIKYGNPNILHLKKLSKKTCLDELFAPLSELLPPKNSSEVTQKEINDLISNVNELMQNEVDGSRYLSYDFDLKNYLLVNCVNVGINSDEIEPVINSIIDDVEPLIYMLKYHFNRPRPFQLAYYYQVQLFPFYLINQNSPSYPSYTACLSTVIKEVLGNKYPDKYKAFDKLNDDVCISRTKLGANYISDVQIAKFCAKQIILNKKFIKKYGL